MTAVVSALDEFTPTQTGEKRHKEYTWSNSIQERILQLSFQLTRTNDEDQLNKLDEVYGKLLEEVFYCEVISEETTNHQGFLLALIPYVRDIISGKGEYNLYYHLIGVWTKTIEDWRKNTDMNKTDKMEQLLFAVIRCSVYLDGFDHPIGSWKDMKYLLNHLWVVFGEKKLIKMRVF